MQEAESKIRKEAKIKNKRRDVKMSELIVMLTNNDVTVPDAMETFESVKDLPVKYWGFKEWYLRR